MKILILLLFLAFNNYSQAQLTGQAQLDSLLNELPKAKADSNKVNLLTNISYEYYTINPDKGILYGERAAKLSNKIKWKVGLAKSYNSMGANYYSKSNFPKALEYYEKGLRINEEIGDKAGIAGKLGNMGLIYWNQANYTKALEFYKRALKINREIGDNVGTANTLGNMGLVYWNQSNYEKALEYLQKALKIYEELDIKYGVAVNLGNIGGVYLNQKLYYNSLEYYKKALKINEELGNKKGIALNLGRIGDLYYEILNDSININTNEVKQKASLENEISLNNAIDNLKQSILIFEETGEIDNRSKLLDILAKVYRKQEDYKNADKYFRESITLKDSIFNKEKQKEIAKLTAERDKIESEKEAIIQEEITSQRNRLQYLALGALVVAFGVLLLLSGRMKLEEWMARALVFLSFLFLFEFALVMIDPWTDEFSEGIPIIKFGINMCLALIIFPMHQYLEKRVSLKVIKPNDLSIENIMEEFRKRKAEGKM